MSIDDYPVRLYGEILPPDPFDKLNFKDPTTRPEETVKELVEHLSNKNVRKQDDIIKNIENWIDESPYMISQ